MSTTTPEALRRLADDLAEGRFPAHIDALPVAEKLKRAFTFFEACEVTQPMGLFPAPPKAVQAACKKLDFKGRRAVNRLTTTNIWWAFFFGPFYYFFAGMWKKGLTLLGGVFLLCFIFAVVYHGLLEAPESRAVDTGISVGISWAVSVMASYDLYRFKVKHEDFWW